MFRTDSILELSAGSSGTIGRLLLWSLVVLVPAGTAAAQEMRTPRAPITPDVSLVATKRLEGVRDFLAREQWGEALDALEELSGNLGDSLIEVELGRFLNVHDVCLATTAGMPPAGLAEYRRRVDGVAGFLYDEALTQDQPGSMRQLLETWYASSYGDDALSWLAEDAWARGDLDRARLYWTQLVPLAASPPPGPLVLRYPDTDIPRSSILARLVLCSILQGDRVAAGSELDAFREMYPSEQGKLAGREGSLCEILQDVLVEAGGWPADGSAGECPTFACRPDRNAVAPDLPPLLRALWTTRLAGADVPLVDGPRPQRAAGTFPVVWKGIVVIQDASGIRALNLSDGRPAWPSGRPNDRGMIYQVAGADSTALPSVGIARYSGTVADGHYYTRVGPPVVTAAAGSLRQIEDRLVSLDLEEGEGRLRWDVNTDELLNEEGWRFTGAPLAVSGRLYVTLRRAVAQVEVAVACVDAGTGDLIWRQPVAIDLESPLESRNRLDHELLTFATGTLFFANQAGLVVALDANSGRLEWVATYPSFPLSPAELSHPANAGLLPPVFDRGTLYVAPRDAAQIMAFDAASGVLRWQTRKPGRISSLPGVTENMVVAAGDRLWRIDADTGRLHPPSGYDDPAGYGFGRPAIAGSSVYWTTQDELFEIDLASGRTLQRLPLEVLGLSGGGNLVIVDNCLLFAEPDRLTVFSVR